MGTADFDKLYGALSVPPSVVVTPNTVSRNIKVGDRAFTTGVQESGKIVLDSELQLHQDAAWWESFLLKGWQIPSGWLRGQNRGDSYNDFYTTIAPAFFNDSSTPSHIITGGFPPIPDGTLWNSFILPRLEAVVAGHPVVVEYTNTTTEGGNLVVLEAPPSTSGAPPVVKRTDFVFLEVWLALVAPSPLATGSVVIEASGSITAGDKVTVNGTDFVAGAGWVIVAGNNTTTAANLAALITATIPGVVTATSSGSVVTVTSTVPGAAGNAILLIIGGNA